MTLPDGPTSGDHDPRRTDAPDDARPGAAPGDAQSGDAPAGGARDDASGGEGSGDSTPPGAALAEMRGRTIPPRPPRRTGVFVDAEDLRVHVGGLLRAILGGYEVDAFGNFTFGHEGARVFVTVGPTPIGPQVGVFSVTNLDVDLTPDLASFLVTTNHHLGFGAFSYDVDNRSVWLRHTLLGTTLDGPELQSSVAAVATTAAQLDERIRDRFGGRTFADSPDDVQRGVEPPSVDHDVDRSPNASGYL